MSKEEIIKYCLELEDTYKKINLAYDRLKEKF